VVVRREERACGGEGGGAGMMWYENSSVGDHISVLFDESQTESA
jgi:hypothetical protein